MVAPKVRDTNTIRLSSPDRPLEEAIAAMQMGRFKDAEAGLRQHLTANPADLDAIRLVGVIACYTGDPVSGIEIFKSVLQADPNHLGALKSMTTALIDIGLLKQATRYAQKAFAQDPDDLICIYNRQAVRKSFTTAYGYNYWSGRINSLAISRRSFSIPPWDGTYIGPDKQILVYWEDGTGDNIMFMPFVKKLKQMSGAKIKLELAPHLYPVFKDFEFADEVTEHDSDAGSDYYVPLITAMLRACATIEDLPIAVNYLKADPARVAELRARLDGDIVIGICWQGNSNCSLEPHRKLALEPMLAAIKSAVEKRGDDKDFLLLSLLYGSTPLVLNHFGDTLEAVAACDLVITTDTSIPHLAGASGVPVWLILPDKVIDWRWDMNEDGTSPWYPSMRIFYPEGKFGAAGSPLERMTEALAAHDFDAEAANGR
jgi:tetratricopeptide (TPR) repeat protein